MKKFIPAVLALSLAACGAHATKVTPDQTVKSDTQKARALVLSCSHNGGLLITKSGRQKTISCVDPSGKNQAKLEQCIVQDVSTSHLFTKKGRQAAIDGAANCVVTDR